VAAHRATRGPAPPRLLPGDTEVEMDEENQGAVAGWTLFWTLFGFKVITAIIIFVLQPSVGAAVFLFALHWFWFVPIVGLALAAMAGWRRLARVRARRQQLVRAEFMLDEA
jgi:hypothetical protein